MIGEALEILKRKTGYINRCYLAEMNENGTINKKRYVIFDSVETESWNATTSVSQYAVEKGSDIGDHISVKPQSLSLSASITNHTLINQSAIPGMSIASKYIDVTDSIADRLDMLEGWRKKGTLLFYMGAVNWGKGKDFLKNMVITSMDSSKSSDTGEAVDLKIGLQHVIIASPGKSGKTSPSSVKKTNRKGLVSRIKTSCTPGRNI